jgi:hypothetical protein
MNILLNIVAKYSLDIPTKLLDWILMNNIHWSYLAQNSADNIDYWNYLA